MLKPAFSELEITPSASSSWKLNFSSRRTLSCRSTSRGSRNRTTPKNSATKIPHFHEYPSTSVDIRMIEMMIPEVASARLRSSTRLAGIWINTSSSSVLASAR